MLTTAIGLILAFSTNKPMFFASLRVVKTPSKLKVSLLWNAEFGYESTKYMATHEVYKGKLLYE